MVYLNRTLFGSVDRYYTRKKEVGIEKFQPFIYTNTSVHLADEISSICAFFKICFQFYYFFLLFIFFVQCFSVVPVCLPVS